MKRLGIRNPGEPPPPENVLDWSLQLAKAPCGPIDMESPNRLTRRLLENPHDFEVIDGGRA